ncbi:uncharacterized protein TNCV_2492351 [Trichonephila clavipes]|nr:uncharacterized protein TNCV_2492351 [Trichonephila clavipes]
MTIHSPTENSLAVLNHKILEANSQVQNVKLGGHQTCLSINRLWHELCVLLEPQLLDIMIVQFRNEKIRSNSWDAQLAVPNDPRYARLETNLRKGQAKEEYLQCRDSLVTTLPCDAVHCLVEKWLLGGSRCMSGNTCGCRMSWTYHWAVMRPRINTRVQFSRAWHHSKQRHRWVGVKGSTRNGRRDPKCPSARRLRKVREDTRALIGGGTCVWRAADETVGCMRAFLTMWRSPR